MSTMKRKAPSQAPAEGALCKGKSAEQRWRERLSRLNTERDCTASMSGDSCWLCDNIEQWNAVLNPLQIDLYETEPGKISVFTAEWEGPAPLREEKAAYHAAFFTVWLQRKHRCVDTVVFMDGHPDLNTDAIPHSVAGMPSNLRHITIWGGSFPDWRLDLDVLGPIEQLESLVLMKVKIDSDLATKLARLLEANANSLRVVKFTGVFATNFAADVLMSGVSKCKKVKDLEYGPILNWCGLKEFTDMLRATESLQSLILLRPCDTYNTAVNLESYNRRLLAAVRDLMRKSTTLVEIVYQGYDHGFKGILKALEANDTIRVLVFRGYDSRGVRIRVNVATVLKSVLSKNKRLESLTFEKCTIDNPCGALISVGLLSNRTLKCLDTSDCVLTCPAASALCGALVANKTVSLKIGTFSGTPSQRKALSEKLSRKACYGRVQMCWNDCDAEGLAASLLQPAPCLTELQLTTNNLPEASFCSLCQALSSSCQIRSLTVELSNPTFGQLESLSRGLEENASLQDVKLQESFNCAGSAVQAAQGLCSNKFVMKLTLECFWVSTPSAELVASLMEKNQGLNEVVLSSKTILNRRCVETVSRGVVRNNFITKFSIMAEMNSDCSTAALYTAVERNRTRLHRAVRFALGRNTEKLCAEGFELFASKESLIACIVSTSELTEADAMAAVERARRFILNNYLVINKVYRDKLECNAGEGTQIDKLNFECWLAIIKHLKVCDVIGV